MTDVRSGGWNPGDMPGGEMTPSSPGAGPLAATFAATKSSKLRRASLPKGVVAGIVGVVAVSAVVVVTAAAAPHNAGTALPSTTTPTIPRVSVPPTTVYSPTVTAPVPVAPTTTAPPAPVVVPPPAPAPAPTTTAPTTTAPLAPVVVPPPTPAPAPTTTTPPVHRHTIVYTASWGSGQADASYISTDWGVVTHAVVNPNQGITVALQSGARYSIVVTARTARQTISCSVFDDNRLITQSMPSLSGTATCTGLVP